MNKAIKKVSLAPYCYSIPSVHETARLTCFLLLPQVLMLVLTASYRSLAVLGVALLAGHAAQLSDTFFRKQKYVFSWDAVLQALLIGLFIPSGYPLWWLFLIVLCSLLVCKYTFGGFAQSWANPAAFTLIMLYLFGSQCFPGFIADIEHLQSPNAVPLLVRDGLIPLNRFDSVVTGFLNEKLLVKAGITVPDGYVSLMLDAGGPIPAFRFNLLTLIASIVLFSSNMIEPLIPTVYLLGYGALVRYFGLYPYGGLLNQGDILLALFSSGTLITAFFLLPWGGTVPMSIPGKFLFALFAAIMAAVVNGFGTSPIGSMFVILAANVFSPAIQCIEDALYYGMLDKRRAS
ncbi:MAG: RnfABCDGE type electron transport complex subunit D [Treponemataceae bacterium]|nr:RnfABCDGE type electron transport complex subunit D [Treponemataceae bacterium]